MNYDKCQDKKHSPDYLRKLKYKKGPYPYKPLSTRQARALNRLYIANQNIILPLLVENIDLPIYFQVDFKEDVDWCLNTGMKRIRTSELEDILKLFEMLDHRIKICKINYISKIKSLLKKAQREKEVISKQVEKDVENMLKELEHLDKRQETIKKQQIQDEIKEIDDNITINTDNADN